MNVRPLVLATVVALLDFVVPPLHIVSLIPLHMGRLTNNCFQVHQVARLPLVNVPIHLCHLTVREDRT
jgi:hypothetical protein